MLLAGCSSTSTNQKNNLPSSSKPTTSISVAPQKPTNATLRMNYDLAIDYFKTCLMENEFAIPYEVRIANKDQTADKILAACENRLTRVEMAGTELYVATANMTYEDAKAAAQKKIQSLTADYRERITGNKQREENKTELKRVTEKEKNQQKKYTECLDTAVNQKYMLSGTPADITAIIITQCDVEIREWAKLKLNALALQNIEELSIEKSRDDQDKLLATLGLVRKEMWDVVLTKVIAKRNAANNLPPSNSTPKQDSGKKSKGVDI